MKVNQFMYDWKNIVNTQTTQHSRKEYEYIQIYQHMEYTWMVLNPQHMGYNP